MSLATWMAEYCPVAVADVPKGGELPRDLLKWTGLLAENLERHGLKVDLRDKAAIMEIGDEEVRLVIDADTCSLCEAYLHGYRTCSECPLHKVRGAMCDEVASDEDDDDTVPYFAFSINANPQPMIDLIRKAIAAEEKAK